MKLWILLHRTELKVCACLSSLHQQVMNRSRGSKDQQVQKQICCLKPHVNVMSMKYVSMTAKLKKKVEKNKQNNESSRRRRPSHSVLKDQSRPFFQNSGYNVSHWLNQTESHHQQVTRNKERVPVQTCEHLNRSELKVCARSSTLNQQVTTNMQPCPEQTCCLKSDWTTGMEEQKRICLPLSTHRQHRIE